MQEQTRSSSSVFVVTGLILGAAGLAWAAWGSTSNVTYAAVEGISVFAVLYLIAQSSERITELLVNAVSLVGGPEEKKQAALKELRQLNSKLEANLAATEVAKAAEDKADQKSTVDAARKELAFFAGGLSVLLCGIGVNALNYGLTSRLGATGVNLRLDRVLTTLAAAGGTKTLHELIGRFEKAKESADE